MPIERPSNATSDGKGSSGSTSSEPSSLPPPNFVRGSQIPVTPRTSYFLCGDTGSGKSACAIRYSPAPLLVLYYDGRSEAEIQWAEENAKEIYAVSMGLPELTSMGEQAEVVQKDCLDVMRQTVSNIKSFTKTHRNGTVVIDGAYELDRIADLSYDGIGTSARGDVWGKDSAHVKQFWYGINRLALMSNSHFCFTIRASEIWGEDKKPTGEFKYQGSKAIAEICVWGGYLSVDFSRIGVSEQSQDIERRIRCKIIKAGRNLSQLRRTISFEDWGEHGLFAYQSFMQNRKLFPEMTLKQWSKGV